ARSRGPASARTALSPLPLPAALPILTGAQALVAAGRPRARRALIGEPTGMVPVAAHKGILVERLRIRGRSGHSSDPERGANALRSEEHTSELQSRENLVCRLLLEKKK